MAKKSGNIFFNIMTSGKRLEGRDESQMDVLVRYILLNFLIFMGGSLLFGFGITNLQAGELAKGLFDIGMGVMAIVGFIVLRTNAPFLISALLTVVPYMGLCMFFVQTGGARGSGILWIYSFPMMAVFLLGMRGGIALSLMLFVYTALGVFIPGFTERSYPVEYAYRVVGVYILVLACTVVYEYIRLTKDKWVAKLTKSLKAERDEMAAMKDNLKVGLFLMSDDYVIQPQYSRALESVLSESDLSGKNFLDLLRSSIQQKERETLTDYFAMVFNRAYDAQMLEDINPLHQFTYVHAASDERKILRCSFSPITREDGKTYVLATVQDQTREVELQNQLAAEEEKRAEEMRALFEVIHVEPRVLHDFIEDTEYEFGRINDILKDESRSSHDVMVDIYQSVHAIKSNAVILGLESFATKLHALEDEIRVLREQPDVAFGDILHITVEIDALMKVKDGFRDLIERIATFNMGEKKMQEEYVLVQTLERTIERAGSDLGKKAKLVVKGIDPSAISNGPRRAMKEILMQLVRNAVYHGIEDAGSRSSSGKDAVGNISLSIETVNDAIVIRLTDDGRGLDFNAIRDKASKLNLITDPAQLSDKNALTQVLFAPGFSTAESADMHAGRGIGLNLVRDRVKELKGSIKLHSEDGKGTTFLISIPAEAVAANTVA
jgi:two-component system chemotaxis sensor kinase CheA